MLDAAHVSACAQPAENSTLTQFWLYTVGDHFSDYREKMTMQTTTEKGNK
jgi:hypothetical protein